MSSPARRHSLTRVAMAVAAAVLASACTSGGSAEPTPEEALATTTTTPVGTFVVDSRAVDVRVNVDGFDITIGEVRLEENRVGQRIVAIAMSVVNNGTPARFDSTATLRRGRATWSAPAATRRIDTEGRSETVVGVPVGPEFGLAGTTLEIGPPGGQAAVIPLNRAARSSSLLTRRPATQDLDIAVRAGEMTATARQITVRTDDPANHETLTAGRALVIVRVDLRRGTGGDPAVGADNLLLRLPDDTLIGPRPDGHSAPNAVVGQGGVVADVRVRFEIPAAALAADIPLRLVLTGDYGPFGEAESAEVPIPAPPGLPVEEPAD